MLGSAVLDLAVDAGLDISGTTTDVGAGAALLHRDRLVEFDANKARVSSVVHDLSEGDYVINCIGLIKHMIDDQHLADRQLAITLNATLPHELDRLAQVQGFRVLQIATDCVYSGRDGGYAETSSHDEGDVYGQSKSLGEVPSSQFMHVRASIIGRELRAHRSLIDWVLSQPTNAEVTGYSDHFWNGVSTVAFARIALGLIAESSWRAGTFHLVPKDVVAKADLLSMVLRAFGRQDILVRPARTQHSIDRTLTTLHHEQNAEMWAAGGYMTPPTIEQMVLELGAVQGVGR